MWTKGHERFAASAVSRLSCAVNVNQISLISDCSSRVQASSIRKTGIIQDILGAGLILLLWLAYAYSPAL